jgi:serine protease inhibitor
MRIFRYFAIALLLLTLHAFGADPMKLSTSFSKFGFQLFSQLAQDTSQNVVFSPSSIASALTMVLNGARGETKNQMGKALQLPDVPLMDLNSAYSQWRTEAVVPDPNVELDIANSLWGRKDVRFNPSFLTAIKTNYGAQVTDLDFNSPSAPGTINQWVKSNTHGKIDRIVDQIDSASVLFLINAVYFKGKWNHPFIDSDTTSDTFTTASGSNKRVPFMHQHHTFRYYEDPQFQAVSLPYGDKRLSMYIFLPAKSVTLTQLYSSFTADQWEKWMAKFEDAEGSIALPRFRVEYDVTLNDALKALGMRDVFNPQSADLTEIVQVKNGNAFLSKVQHKAFTEVNEEGTEAAATTSAQVQVASMAIGQKTFQMIVNRPFFFAIRDNKTGTLLFLGSVAEP